MCVAAVPLEGTKKRTAGRNIDTYRQNSLTECGTRSQNAGLAHKMRDSLTECAVELAESVRLAVCILIFSNGAFTLASAGVPIKPLRFEVLRAAVFCQQSPDYVTKSVICCYVKIKKGRHLSGLAGVASAHSSSSSRAPCFAAGRVLELPMYS